MEMSSKVTPVFSDLVKTCKWEEKWGWGGPKYWGTCKGLGQGGSTLWMEGKVIQERAFKTTISQKLL